MKLYYTNTSPYSRKVRLVLREKGLLDSVSEVLCNPFIEKELLASINPLGQIPTLVTCQGDAIFDSPVICEYLDSLRPESSLLPRSGEERLIVLRWQAISDGVMDSAYNIVMEQRRDASQQSPEQITHWMSSIKRSLDYMDKNIASELPSHITLAQLSIAAALGYLDFRLNHIQWKSSRATLSQWYESLSERDSMVKTSHI